MPLFHSRTTPRAQRYDYHSAGMYFITICTQDRVHYFGEIRDGKMMLSDIGKICDREILALNTRKFVDVHERIIMPNHVHLLLYMGEFTTNMNKWYHWNISETKNPSVRRDALEGRPHDNITNIQRTGHEPVPTYIVKHDDYGWPRLGQIVNVLKWNVSKYAQKNNIPFVRQSRYHDKIVRDQNMYQTIKYYIETNVDKRSQDVHYTED